MSARRFSAKNHITQTHRLTTLRMMLIQTSNWPPSVESLIRTSGCAPGVVMAEVAAEQIRRDARHG